MPPALQTTSRNQCAPIFLERPRYLKWQNRASKTRPSEKKVLAPAIVLPHEWRMPELKVFASSVAAVVSSCDAFFDTWRPFFFFFRKHWSDCPLPVFLIVNQL